MCIVMPSFIVLLAELISTASDFKVIITTLASALGIGKIWQLISKRMAARDNEIKQAREEVKKLYEDRIKSLEAENKRLRK